MATSSLIRPSFGLTRPTQSTFGLLVLRSSPAACLSPATLQQSSSFSSSPTLQKRRRYKTRDRSRLRGVSTVRRTGPKEFLSVSNTKLPMPVRRLPAIEVDADHGLWDFFYDKKMLQTPTEDADHGRAWVAEELRKKSWEDLHRLWWVCVKERNRIATASRARDKEKIGYGQHEATRRDDEIKATMRRIKHVLTERQYTWEDAVELAREDPEINLSGEGPAFTPSEYLEEDTLQEDESDTPSEVELSPEVDETKTQETAQTTSTTGTLEDLPANPPPTQTSQEQPRV